MFGQGNPILFSIASLWSDPDADRAPDSDQPNIIVILSDDQGWGDLSIHGNSNLRTPNIDRLCLRRHEVRPFLCLPHLLTNKS